MITLHRQLAFELLAFGLKWTFGGSRSASASSCRSRWAAGTPRTSGTDRGRRRSMRVAHDPEGGLPRRRSNPRQMDRRPRPAAAGAWPAPRPGVGRSGGQSRYSASRSLKDDAPARLHGQGGRHARATAHSTVGGRADTASSARHPHAINAQSITAPTSPVTRIHPPTQHPRARLRRPGSRHENRPYRHTNTSTPSP